MRSHCIMHVPFEGPGYVEEWFNEKNNKLKVWPLYKDVKLPDSGEVDFLVIMGGPMNIYETSLYPWLKPEISLLRSCLEQGTKMLGICLGAQLLANMLGSKIYSCPEKEIGWFPVNLDGSIRDHVLFRSMPETFDIPKGATRIGSSEACRNQGFLFKEQKRELLFGILDKWLGDRMTLTK